MTIAMSVVLPEHYATRDGQEHRLPVVALRWRLVRRGYSLLFSAFQYPGTETCFGLNTLKIDELCVLGLEKVVTYGDMVICSV